MKILITGTKGFITKNLYANLVARKKYEVLKCDLNAGNTCYKEFSDGCDCWVCVVNENTLKTKNLSAGKECYFIRDLLGDFRDGCKKRPSLIVLLTQTTLNNSFSKIEEEYVLSYGEETGTEVIVYRMPGVFGKWCEPDCDSVIATYCNSIANDMPIVVNDRKHMMNLVYIDDVVNEIIYAIEGNANRKEKFCEISPVYKKTLGEIVDLIYSFKFSRDERKVPDMSDGFTKALYATYLSYLPEDKFSYSLKMNVDERGSFTEFIRTLDRGQLSVNISKPGITKGNHWHNTKNEKFVIVSGKGVVRFRKLGEDKVIEYFASGDKIEVIDIPTGYTHNIENIGDTDLVTIMWCNEPFDPEEPDTFFLEV